MNIEGKTRHGFDYKVSYPQHITETEIPFTVWMYTGYFHGQEIARVPAVIRDDEQTDGSTMINLHTNAREALDTSILMKLKWFPYDKMDED